MSFVLVLRLTGASLMVLAVFHAVLWRTFRWGPEIARLSPLNARVFVVHMFFITFVLFALGLLSLARPDLLLAPSDLARLLLYAIVLFWVFRLLLQPLVFDKAMRVGWTGSPLMRVLATALWASYVTIYGVALYRQLGDGAR